MASRRRHPRCLEYLDALLAGGQARFADVRIRLFKAASARLSAQGHRTTDIDRYLSEHGQLDAALAETAALAADDVLLDDLLTDLEVVPHARALLLGASVYRRAVDHHALAYQLGSPDPNSANTAAVQAARQAIQDILARAQYRRVRLTWPSYPRRSKPYSARTWLCYSHHRYGSRSTWHH